MEANKIIEAAREYVGTPFLHQGRVKGLGIDCAGLIECVARDVGMAVKVHDGYGRTPFKGLLEKTVEQYLARSEPHPGCVLLIKFPQMQYPSHLAIFTGRNIIHAWSGPGKCVEHIYDQTWKRRTVRAYAWPKL